MKTDGVASFVYQLVLICLFVTSLNVIMIVVVATNKKNILDAEDKANYKTSDEYHAEYYEIINEFIISYRRCMYYNLGFLVAQTVLVSFLTFDD